MGEKFSPWETAAFPARRADWGTCTLIDRCTGRVRLRRLRVRPPSALTQNDVPARSASCLGHTAPQPAVAWTRGVLLSRLPCQLEVYSERLAALEVQGPHPSRPPKTFPRHSHRCKATCGTFPRHSRTGPTAKMARFAIAIAPPSDPGASWPSARRQMCQQGPHRKHRAWGSVNSPDRVLQICPWTRRSCPSSLCCRRRPNATRGRIRAGAAGWRGRLCATRLGECEASIEWPRRGTTAAGLANASLVPVVGPRPANFTGVAR